MLYVFDTCRDFIRTVPVLTTDTALTAPADPGSVRDIAIEVLIGSIPLFGDIFDIAWKANRRNYRLMMRHLRQPHEHTWKDYVFLLSLLAAVLAILAIPIIVLLLIIIWIAHRM